MLNNKFIFQLTIVLACFSKVACAGTINYEIIDYSKTAQGQSIAKGSKKQSISDIKIVDQSERGSTLWSKSVLLENGYSIGFSDSKEIDLSGFGMWVENENHDFSWDWFNRSDENEFIKLKESGRIKVRTTGTNIQEIAEIEFLTDVSLRAIEMGGSHKILQRVIISKGSVINVLP
jgi:hypothetical protein